MSRHSPTSAPIRPDEDCLEPTRLMFFGDPRGEFEPIGDAVQRERPQAILPLGDLQAERPLQVELAAIRASAGIWFIHGNHDNDTERYSDHLSGSELADRNLHGRVVRIASCLVAGLGASFANGCGIRRSLQPKLVSLRCVCSVAPLPPTSAGAWGQPAPPFHHLPRRTRASGTSACRHPRDPRGPWREGRTASRGSTRLLRPCV